ncbi:response regulator [Muricauda sp. 334s03]|uniref:Response regulator n=1 Tax=Flagellimonas yonaguniensis TaxID=3031325 RepID=A0ABT5XWL2_9FLAO|nr:response regulator [[Muricauda] yonaguniensis]MDF0715525.1 response regulator [[Muricauda] yonaguniensis]
MKKVSCIFIVDDDPITVFGIKKMLKSVADCKDIQIFQNGKEAYDALIERQNLGKPIPEVIFLDINMPIMDGWDFLDEMIELNITEHVVINMITSSIDPLDYKKWADFKDRCPYILNFKNKPIFKIEPNDLGCITAAS